MKKKIFIWLFVIVILGTGIGCCYYYRDTINKTINGWMENFVGNKTETSYSKLESLFLQMDNNDNEIEQLNKKIEENQLLIQEKLLIDNSETAKEIEKLRAVNDVFLSRIIDLENENKELENEIVTLQNQMNLTKTEIEELRNQITTIKNQLSKKATIELLSQNYTYTQKTYSLSSGKKFSNYSVLYFIFEQTDTYQYISMAIPVDLFKKGNSFEMTTSSANKDRYMQFCYKSDTSYYVGANSYVEFRYIYGLRK